MGDAEGTGHDGVVAKLVGSSFLETVNMMSRRGMQMHTFNRTAVSGSMTCRTSCTSWLTLLPTSCAPMRMTMLFGWPFSGFFDFSLSVADCRFLWLLPLAILVVQWWCC
jgi:hypothetical protein